MEGEIKFLQTENWAESPERDNMVEEGICLKKERTTTYAYIPPTIPPEDATLAKFTFIMVGFAGAFNWSAIMTTSLIISTTVYGFPDLSGTLLIGHFLFSVSVSFTMAFLRRVTPRNVHFSCASLTVSTICIPLCTQYLEGLLGIVVLHILAMATGLASSLLVSNSISFSSLPSSPLVGFVVAGNGLSGFLAFLVWQLINVFFDVNDLNGARTSVWCLFLCAIPLLWTLDISFYKLSHKKWFLKAYNDFVEGVKNPAWRRFTKQEPLNNPLELEVRPFKKLFVDSLPHLLLGYLAFACTYTLFPNIGPYFFQGSNLRESSTLVGVFQAIDFVCRLLPNLIQFFKIRPRPLRYIIFCRLLFFFPIFITLYMVNTPFTTGMLTHTIVIIIFAIFSGLTSSQSMIGVAKNARENLEKGIVGLLIHNTMQVSVASATLFAVLLKLLLNALK